MKLNLEYLRPLKAGLLSERYRLYQEKRGEEGIILEIEDAMIIAGKSTSGSLVCGVADCDGRFVELSSDPETGEEIERLASIATRVEHREESAVFLGSFNAHWGHFITDCLSMFWFLERDLKTDVYVFACERMSPDIYPNIREALQLLGVWGKIRFIDHPVGYKKVFVPQCGMKPREYILDSTKYVYDRIRQAALEGKERGDAPGSYKRILLGRSAFPKACSNDLGTKEMEQLFSEAGYMAVSPEKMSLTELIRLLDGASEVAAITGTLPHNMLFAPDGIKLTLIEKYPTINNYQQGIDILRNLEVTPVSCDWIINSVNPGLGPFLIGITPYLRRFFSERGFPVTLPAGNGVDVSMLRHYFHQYKRHYGRQWILPEWLECEIGLLREAYRESFEEFGNYLGTSRPLMVSDWFNIRLVAKMILGYVKRRKKKGDN